MIRGTLPSIEPPIGRCAPADDPFIVGDPPSTPTPAPGCPGTPPSTHPDGGGPPARSSPTPADLPPELQDILVSEFLHTSDPIPHLAERHGLTIRRLIDWFDSEAVKAVFADLERLSTRRTELQQRFAQPAAVEALSVVATMIDRTPETARRAATILLRAPNSIKRRPEPEPTPDQREHAHRPPSANRPPPGTERAQSVSDGPPPQPADAPRNQSENPVAVVQAPEKATTQPSDAPSCRPSADDNASTALTTECYGEAAVGEVAQIIASAVETTRTSATDQSVFQLPPGFHPHE